MVEKFCCDFHYIVTLIYGIFVLAKGEMTENIWKQAWQWHVDRAHIQTHISHLSTTVRSAKKTNKKNTLSVLSENLSVNHLKPILRQIIDLKLCTMLCKNL